MSKKYIVALDQGTTSSRTVLFDEEGSICGIAQKETEQIYPKPGWVEQNAIEIYQSQLETLHQVLYKQQIDFSEIAAIGITNCACKLAMVRLNSSFAALSVRGCCLSGSSSSSC